MSKKDKKPECIYYRLTFSHEGLRKKYDCHFFDRPAYPQAIEDFKRSDLAIEQILDDLNFDWRHCYASPDYPISKFIRSTEDYSFLEKKLNEKLKEFPFLQLDAFTQVEFHWKNTIRQLPWWKYQSDPEAKKWID